MGNSVVTEENVIASNSQFVVVGPRRIKKNQNMASFDGSLTVTTGSDEYCESFCGQCESNKVRKEANHYCLDCKQNLCDACRDSHRKISSLKSHKVLQGQTNPNLSSLVYQRCFTVNCRCQKNRKVEFYCEDEDLVICASCDTLQHQKCKTTLIQEKSATYTQASLDCIMNKQRSLKKTFKQLLQNLRTDNDKIEDAQNKCMQDIKAFRRELNMLLDTLEEDMIKDLDRYVESQKSSADKHIKTSKETLQVLCSDMNLLEKAKQHGQKETMYAAHVMVSNKWPKYETLIADMEKAVGGCNFSFSRNSGLNDMKGKIRNLGSISGKRISDASIKTIESSRLLYIREEDDRSVPSIVGSGFMQNDKVLLSDFANSKLKLLDTRLEMITDNLQLGAQPCDLSVIDGRNAVVTIPKRKRVQFVKVFPRLRASRFYQLEKKCFGIAVYGSEIYVSCHFQGNGEVRVLDLKCNLIRKLGISNGRFPFLGPHYLTIDKTGKRLYVSNRNKSVVTCMTTNGDTIYQYTDTRLKGPEAIFVDSSGCVFVCNSGAQNVQIITADGGKGSVLLSTRDCLSKPKAVAFREDDDVLIVGWLRQQHLSCFRLAKT